MALPGAGTAAKNLPQLRAASGSLPPQPLQVNPLVHQGIPLGCLQAASSVLVAKPGTLVVGHRRTLPYTAPEHCDAALVGGGTMTWG